MEEERFERCLAESKKALGIILPYDNGIEFIKKCGENSVIVKTVHGLKKNSLGQFKGVGPFQKVTFEEDEDITVVSKVSIEYHLDGLSKINSDGIWLEIWTT